jgi:hypothetical protein
MPPRRTPGAPRARSPAGDVDLGCASGEPLMYQGLPDTADDIPPQAGLVAAKPVPPRRPGSRSASAAARGLSPLEWSEPPSPARAPVNQGGRSHAVALSRPAAVVTAKRLAASLTLRNAIRRGRDGQVPPRGLASRPPARPTSASTDPPPTTNLKISPGGGPGLIV